MEFVLFEYSLCRYHKYYAGTMHKTAMAKLPNDTIQPMPLCHSIAITGCSGCRSYETQQVKQQQQKFAVSKNWKGQAAGYNAIHKWNLRNWKKTGICDICKGKFPKTQWANKSGKYYRARADWLELCIACHATYDVNQRRLKSKLVTL